MKETSVAERYARALFLAVDQGTCLADVQKGLEEIARKIESDVKLKSDLESPIVSLSEKRNLIRKELKIPLLVNFMNLLSAKKRTKLIPLILARFHETVLESLGRLRVRVKSAGVLDASAEKEMGACLSALFKKEVFIETSVNPELLAGVIIQAGDTVIDGSLQSRLKNLKSILIADKEF